MKELLKGTAIIFSFKVLGAAALFASQIVISRFYGVEELGVYNLFLSILMISVIFGQVGVDLYIVRILPLILEDKKKVSGFIYAALKLVLFAASITMFIVMVIFGQIDDYIFKSIDIDKYRYIFPIIIFMFIFCNFFPEIFRGFDQIKAFAFLKGVFQNLVVLSLLLVGAIYNNEKAFYALFIGVVLTLFVQIIYVIALLKNKGISFTHRHKYNDSILKYSYPMFIVASAMTLMGSVDNLMISYYYDESASGIYSAVIQVSLMLTFILVAVNGFIAPKISIAFSNNDGKSLSQIYKSAVRLSVFITWPIFLIVTIFPKFFLSIFGAEYETASEVLVISAISFFINTSFGPVGNFLNMTGNQNVYMWIVLSALGLNIILNAILIPPLALKGASLATLISMGMWNFVSFVVLKKKNII